MVHPPHYPLFPALKETPGIILSLSLRTVDSAVLKWLSRFSCRVRLTHSVECGVLLGVDQHENARGIALFAVAALGFGIILTVVEFDRVWMRIISLGEMSWLVERVLECL